MAPPKGRMGTPRPPVTVALPMTMEQRQSGRHSVSAPRKSNLSPATANASSAASPPAASLDAALMNRDVSGSDSDSLGGSSTRPPKPSDNQHRQLHSSDVEKPVDSRGSSQNSIFAATTTHTGVPEDPTQRRPTGGWEDYAPTTNGINGHSSTQQTPRAASQQPSGHPAALASVAVSQPVPGAPIRADTPVSPRRLDLDLPSHPHMLQQHASSSDQYPNSQVANPPPPQMHHQRMSIGSGLVFGGFHASHTPSPAPHNGGFIPPPPMPVNDLHGFGHSTGQNHAHSGSNGFNGPVNAHFRPDMPPPRVSMDSYNPVPAPIPQPYDSYAPSNSSRYGPPTPISSRYGPPTPHSFHGSQGSVEPNAPEGAQMPFHMPNGMPYPGRGPPEPTGPYPPHGGHFHSLPPGAFQPRPPFIDESIIDGLEHIKSQFSNSEASDCVLELTSPSSLFPPVKLPGHKIILARSPTLRERMRIHPPKDVHILYFTAVDKFVRPDAWLMAVQRLYMHPLLEAPLGPEHYSGVDFAGDNSERFSFALGYAAAGHILGVHEILIRGLEVARRFLAMNTVEAALRFILDDSSQRHTDFADEQNGSDTSFANLEYYYGPMTKILLDSVVRFLSETFPVNFELDDSVTNPEGYCRIPKIPEVSRNATPSRNGPPPIANGTSVHKPAKAGRVGNIKFGDLPAYTDEKPQPQRERSPVFSRILLNLPFDVLRAVLTPESIGQPSWDNAQIRHRVAADVVLEREKRRMRAVEAVRSDLVPDSREIKQRLAAHRRYAIVESWDVLNWQEELIYPHGDEGPPRLVRRWVSHFPAAELEAEPYSPPERPHDISQSMV